MSATVMLTGVLPFVVLVAALLAPPVCLLLLGLYRRAVSRGMAALVGIGLPAEAPRASARPPDQALQIREVRPGDISGVRHSPAYRRAVVGPWQSALVQAFAGIAYALVMTAGWVGATADGRPIVVMRVLVIFWTYYWPGVLAVLLVAANDRGRRFSLTGAYFVVFAALTVVAMARNPDLGIAALPTYWVLINGAETTLLLFFLARPIRAVGPLVLTFLIVLAIGSQFVLSIAGANERVLRVISDVGFAAGFDATGLFIAMIVVGMLIFGALAWPLLRWIGRRYRAKRVSDQSIVLDSIWLLFGVVQSIGLAFEAPPWILTGLAAFVGAKLVTASGMGLLRRATASVAPRHILLLRVFALAKRSELLFDKLRKHLQHSGSIAMIAGPDLVTTTIEPHEFMEFLSGRLSRQFLGTPEDVEQRIADIDLQRDPDNRYRVNEFFCRSDTWQTVMQRLAGISDSVLMDLRSFGPANQGCIYELGQLVDSVDLGRVVFLVDDSTDRAFLADALAGLWSSMSPDSPNRSPRSPTAVLCGIESQSRREISTLLELLLGREGGA